MGKGQSSLIAPSVSDSGADPGVVNGSSKRRSTLFVQPSTKLDDTLSLDLSAAYSDSSHNKASVDNELIASTLGVFFFTEDEDVNSIRISMLINCMKKEHAKRGTILIREGDIGDKLYLVSSGRLEVSVDGEAARLISKGGLIGELALLYDCPRSATVKCLQQSDFLVLHKKDFIQMMSIASPKSIAQRGRWISEAIEIKALGSVGLSVLVNNLESSRLERGARLYLAGERSTRCILIETGTAVIKLPPELVGLPTKEVDKLLGIIRPSEGRRKDWRDVDMRFLIEYLSSVDTKPAHPSSLVESQPEPPPLSAKKEYHTLHEGCILGVGILFAKAGIPFRGQASGFEWKWEKSSSDASMDVGPDIPFSVGGRIRTASYSSGTDDSGAVSPYTCITNSSKLTYSFFNVDTFVDLFGGLSELMKILVKRSTKTKTARQPPEMSKNVFIANLLLMKEKELQRNTLPICSANDFSITGLVASGIMSSVFLATLRYDFSEQPKKYALKVMSKQKILDKGRVRHSMDECKLLAACHSPFVVSCVGFYQTERDLVMCMEAVYYGDLYSIMNPSDGHNKGLPLDMVRFYLANIVMALSHIHSRGIAYRGLRAENVLLKKNGYICLVDFSFAKQIPYLATDMTGYVKIYEKSFTFCGSPEYLAPECVYNTGANHAVDMWALGVLAHELHTESTPFATRRDMSEIEILQSVATRRSSIPIQKSSDLIGGSSWKNLILQLLKTDMSSRLGVYEGDTLAILDHFFFNCIEKENIALMMAPAPFIPSEKTFVQMQSITEESPPLTESTNVFERFESIRLGL